MKPIGKSPSYLIRNSYSYCFRMVVPRDLQKLVGKREMRYSLKTGYLGVAKYKARLLAGQVQYIFKKLREGSLTLSVLSEEAIQKLVSQYIRNRLEALEGGYYDSKKPPFKTIRDYHEHIGALGFYKDRLSEFLAMGNYRPVEGRVADLLEKNGVNQIEKDSVPYIKLCREIYKADLKLLEVEERQLTGDYSYQDELSDIFPAVFPKADTNSQKIIEQTSEKLSAVVAAYRKEKTGDWKPRSRVQYKGIQQFLLDTLGNDTQIHTIDYQTAREFKTTLMAKKNQLGKPLSKSRVTLYINHISSIWNWAKKNFRDQVEINPFDGLQLTDKKTRVDELRDAFTVNDLKKMFVKSKEYGQDQWGRSVNSHFFWIPLIALFSGCRLEEICQLYIEDVQKLEDVWCLDINEDKPDKSVKKGERRIVPLHPFICVELNFIEYVKGLKDQEGRVFPELKRINDRYGHSFGQWFGRFKKRNRIIGKKTFHSFRHTVITTLLEKDVPDHQISQLVGHITSGQTTSRYGKRFKPKVLFDKTIKKLNYGIDLSHLKNSKWVPR